MRDVQPNVRHGVASLSRRTFLFAIDEGTAGVWCYFRADSPDQVRRKYPTLIHVPEEPDWFTDEYRATLMSTMCFDVDTDPLTHHFLLALEQDAQRYRSALGEQVVEPKSRA